MTFSVGVSSAPYVWFDLYGTSGETPRELHRSIRVPGVDGVTLTYTTDSNGKDILLDSRVPTPLMSGDVFRSICFADLSGDGVCELYATVQDGDRYSIQSYDWRTGRLSRLQAENTVDSFLAVQDNCLFLLKKDRREYGATACFQLRRTADGELELLLIDQSEQFGDTSAPYLTDTRLWSIRNEPLQAFMQQFYEYPSVVYDTTGGE